MIMLSDEVAEQWLRLSPNHVTGIVMQVEDQIEKMRQVFTV